MVSTAITYATPNVVLSYDQRGKVREVMFSQACVAAAGGEQDIRIPSTYATKGLLKSYLRGHTWRLKRVAYFNNDAIANYAYVTIYTDFYTTGVRTYDELVMSGRAYNICVLEPDLFINADRWVDTGVTGGDFLAMTFAIGLTISTVHNFYLIFEAID